MPLDLAGVSIEPSWDSLGMRATASHTVVLDQVTHGYVLLDEAIIELADAGRLASVAALLAERTGLLPDTIVRALQAQSEEPVTVLLSV